MAFPQKEANREINSLHIYCTNKQKGCEWQGKLNDINSHLGNSDGCQFEEVKCSNECGKMIQRQYLTNHVETECPRRKVNCQYCHDTGEHQFIEGQHKEECLKLPLPCPNKCEVGSVPREDREAHRKECPLEMIQCEYYSVGCEVRMARNDQEKHRKEKMEDHLMKITHKLADTNSKLAIALQRISTLEVLLYLATDKAITRPTSSAVVLESSVGWSDKLVAMVMMSKSGNQMCPVVLKIPEFSKEKGRLYSNSFYSHTKGYSMCLCIHPAGLKSGKGTHLSVFLHLMKGPHDDELTWPLRGKFEIKILNQFIDSEHHSMTPTFDDRTSDKCKSRVTKGDTNKDGWDKAQYISNEDLNKITPTRQYLKDDSLFFQVTKL